MSGVMHMTDRCDDRVADGSKKQATGHCRQTRRHMHNYNDADDGVVTRNIYQHARLIIMHAPLTVSPIVRKQAVTFMKSHQVTLR